MKSALRVERGRKQLDGCKMSGGNEEILNWGRIGEIQNSSIYHCPNFVAFGINCHIYGIVEIMVLFQVSYN